MDLINSKLDDSLYEKNDQIKENFEYTSLLERVKIRVISRGGIIMQRFGSVIMLNEEKKDVYFELHANPWPEINKMISECNIKNYSIYYKDGYLFSYFEYHGVDYASDIAKMAADPMTQKWWDLCKPCQKPLETNREGEWWAEMQEVYHLD